MAYIDIYISADEWFGGASESEKEEMREYLDSSNQIIKSLEGNHFLKQNVLLALNQFNEKANIGAMNDFIRAIEDL